MDFLNFDRSASSGILIVSGAVIRSCHPCRYFICIYWLCFLPACSAIYPLLHIKLLPNPKLHFAISCLLS
jgi:hypothetical protein